MQTSTEYIDHVNIVKELNLYTSLNDTQKKYEEQFEAVYEKAKEADVKLDTAKDFLNSLSRSEQVALQKFEGLAELFEVDSLSNEGAYNLLVHRYEKYDWNNDGTTEVGAARTRGIIPQNMDSESKQAWVEAMNAMGDDTKAIFVIASSLDEEYLKHQIATHLSQMSDAQLDEMQEHAGYDIRAYINETLSKPYVPKTITFLDIMNKIDTILNNSDNGYSSPEMLASTQKLKEALEQAYAQVQAEKQEKQIVTEQQIEIKAEAQITLSEEQERA